jgi:hypothetical protein
MAVEEGGMLPFVRPTLDRWFSPGFSANHPDPEKFMDLLEPFLLNLEGGINSKP